jgi:hypothetical protein
MKRRESGSGAACSEHNDTPQGAQSSGMYPPTSDRILRCLEEFCLPKSSAAAEILSDFIKAWIDPQAMWPAWSPDEATARAVTDETCRRLYEHIQFLRTK